LSLKLILLLLGAILVIEGLPYFVAPERVKLFLNKISEMENKTLRIIGSLMIVTGLLIVYFLKESIRG
jgi:uncharacterized protein YjeT (DUF2065 family)